MAENARSLPEVDLPTVAGATVTDDNPDLFAPEVPVVAPVAKISDRTITADLLARLRRHYIKPGSGFNGGLFVPEVGWNNGGGGNRCDVIYVGFTSTSGRMMIGHEVKASRSDWLNELKKAGKADAWADQCHAWYVVAPSTAVVKPEELPAGWGLLVPGPSKTRMAIAVSAATKPLGHTPSWDAVRSVMARSDTLSVQDVFEAKRAAEDSIRSEVERRVAERVEFAASNGETVRLRNELAAIASALGVEHVRTAPGRSWRDGAEISVDEIREAAAYLRAHRDIGQAAESLLGRYADPTERLSERVNELASALDALRGLVMQPQTSDITTAAAS